MPLTTVFLSLILFTYESFFSYSLSLSFFLSHFSCPPSSEFPFVHILIINPLVPFPALSFLFLSYIPFLFYLSFLPLPPPLLFLAIPSVTPIVLPGAPWPDHMAACQGFLFLSWHLISGSCYLGIERESGREVREGEHGIISSKLGMVCGVRVVQYFSNPPFYAFMQCFNQNAWRINTYLN